MKKLIEQWAKENPEEQAKAFVVSRRAKGRGGRRGFTTHTGIYLIKNGKVAQQRCFKATNRQLWAWNGVHPETREVFLIGVFGGSHDPDPQNIYPPVVLLIDNRGDSPVITVERDVPITGRFLAIHSDRLELRQSKPTDIRSNSWVRF